MPFIVSHTKYCPSFGIGGPLPIRHHSNFFVWESTVDSRSAPSQWETSLQSNTVSHWLGANLADSRSAPSQWETSLQSNAVSHWLGANLESALRFVGRSLQLSLVSVSTRVPVSISRLFSTFMRLGYSGRTGSRTLVVDTLATKATRTSSLMALISRITWSCLPWVGISTTPLLTWINFNPSVDK